MVLNELKNQPPQTICSCPCNKNSNQAIHIVIYVNMMNDPAQTELHVPRPHTGYESNSIDHVLRVETGEDRHATTLQQSKTTKIQPHARPEVSTSLGIRLKTTTRVAQTHQTGSSSAMRNRNVMRIGGNLTHYRVSGGPMMVTCHSKTLLSSTSPAENPSTGCLARSASTTTQTNKRTPNQSKPAGEIERRGGTTSRPDPYL